MRSIFLHELFNVAKIERASPLKASFFMKKFRKLEADHRIDLSLNVLSTSVVSSI